jgi:hypothetical protein
MRITLLSSCICSIALADTQSIMPGPSGSERFGSNVLVLPNGNFVVTDPRHDTAQAVDAGAVSLHRPDGSLISRLVGSRAGDQIGASGVELLPNGNFVIQSPIWNGRRGAATWVDGKRGLAGEVSELNSLVGDMPNSSTGWWVVALTNGNYVVSSPTRSASAGAVTWCDGAIGRRGQVSSANSLVGSQAGDGVPGSVVALPTGNYVVVSSNWNNGPILRAGAVTFGNGETGIVGAVSPENSLVGSSPLDEIGAPNTNGITVLADGSYVVTSWGWDESPMNRDVGAITWGSGISGVVGPVSATNSLVGSQPGDRIGTHTTALANGNYMVISHFSNSLRGAATWCPNGSGGCTGDYLSNVTLLGKAANDFQFAYAVALANGNAALSTLRWDSTNGDVDVGSVTWIDGQTGLQGDLDGNASLTGKRTGDEVGTFTAALPSGNYVVGSPQWDLDVRADVGAATWQNGTRASPGPVVPANSLVGKSRGDNVGEKIVAFEGDDYVVVSPGWDNTISGVPDVGAITYCAGANSCGSGVITSPSLENSLTGKSTGDFAYASITHLGGSDFVVTNSGFDDGPLHDAGAITWWSGATDAELDSSNSLLGSYAEDRLGNGGGIVSHADGSYTVKALSYGQNDEGAIVFGHRGRPLLGAIDPSNSVIGTQPDKGFWLNQSYDTDRRQLIVGDRSSNRTVLYRPGEITTTELIAGTLDPEAVELTIRLEIAASAEMAPPTGRTRVYSDSGESCEGVSHRSVGNEDGFASHSECSITFSTDGIKELRAEHFGDDTFGYSSSIPLSLWIAPPRIFADGFD